MSLTEFFPVTTSLHNKYLLQAVSAVRKLEEDHEIEDLEAIVVARVSSLLEDLQALRHRHFFDGVVENGSKQKELQQQLKKEEATLQILEWRLSNLQNLIQKHESLSAARNADTVVSEKMQHAALNATDRAQHDHFATCNGLLAMAHHVCLSELELALSVAKEETELARSQLAITQHQLEILKKAREARQSRCDSLDMNISTLSQFKSETITRLP
jgi:3-methyladenine DNA glycosylase Tag